MIVIIQTTTNSIEKLNEEPNKSELAESQKKFKAIKKVATSVATFFFLQSAQILHQGDGIVCGDQIRALFNAHLYVFLVVGAVEVHG